MARSVVRTVALLLALTAEDGARGQCAAQLVSQSASGQQGAHATNEVSLSDDGLTVAFTSRSPFLPDDTNGSEDVYVRDLATGAVTRVSVTSSGQQTNRPSGSPHVSADGRYVVFTSSGALVPSKTHSHLDVFLHDRQTGTTERASVTSSGGQSNQSSLYPSVSADGRFVAFTSLATNLVPGDTNRMRDAFVRDRLALRTIRVSVGPGLAEADGNSHTARVSADGSVVAFSSAAGNLVPGDSNANWDAFVHDLATQTTTLASVATGGVQGNAGSAGFHGVDVSGDGRYVLFVSLATNLVPGYGRGVYVHDREHSATTVVSVDSAGVAGDSLTHSFAISADGRWVAMASEATNLVPGDTNGTRDVFLHDRISQATLRASVGPQGQQGAGISGFLPDVSVDGAIAFVYSADDLVTGDANGLEDAFVRDCPLPPATYCEAKRNSCGALPGIGFEGFPSAGASSGFLVRATGTRGGKAGLLLYTDGGQAQPPQPFQGGVLCIGPPVKRSVAVVDASGAPGACAGVLALDMNAFAAGALGGNPLPSIAWPGTRVDCQFWGRDTPGNSLLSDAFRYVVGI